VSPPTSGHSSPSSPKHPASLHIDLSSIPPLITPAPPTNTLLITNLLDPAIFAPQTLDDIKALINSSAPLHSFSPLKSLRRIIASFHSTDDAIRIRQLLDGQPIMGDRVRIYFGEATPIEVTDQHLQAPKSQKLFFISPPPSPPFGWEIRDEEPPNKEVHADDLAAALATLHAKPGPRGDLEFKDNSEEGNVSGGEAVISAGGTRRQSKSVVYHPGDHGDSPLLPAVMVEDLTEGEDTEPDGEETKILAHTARPPVELMMDS